MKRIKIAKEKLMLSLVLGFSSFLNFAFITKEGYGNLYYAAGVRSMLQNFKNFFFVSLDPAGFVSIDKPPLGFMIQTISAHIFGFKGWAIILPEAVAGVISIAIVYHLVKKSFGIISAFISAIIFTVTPIFVASSRNNTIDNLLILTLLIGAWAITKAAQKGSFKYVMIASVMVGLGFNIKMLQAYMVLPAFYLVYLLSRGTSLKNRIKYLIAATVVIGIISMAWPIAVDLTPKSSRPFVGSSTNNTVTELILGHNGIERISQNKGQNGPLGQKQNSQNNQNSQNGTGSSGQIPVSGSTQKVSNTSQSGINGSQGMQFPQGGGQGMQPPPTGGQNAGPGFLGGADGKGEGGQMGRSGGGFKDETGDPGLFRLFDSQTSGQVTWFIPLAFFGILAVLLREKKIMKLDNLKKISVTLWAAWLIPMLIYFSFTQGLFHRYYLSMLAPAVAALSGIGLVQLYELYRGTGWKKWILPIALITDGIVQLICISYYSSWNSWITPLVAALCFGSALVLLVLAFIGNREFTKIKNSAIAIALMSLLIAPTMWSFTPMYYGNNGTLPFAGPGLSGKNGSFMGMPGSGNNKNEDATVSDLAKFLLMNRNGEKYIVATQSSQNYGSQLVIKTGQGVMVMGGFSGSDNIVATKDIAAMVKKGEIRYFIVSGMGNMDSGISEWVKANGKLVPESTWRTTSSVSQNSQNNFGPMGMNSVQLYDCKPSSK